MPVQYPEQRACPLIPPGLRKPLDTPVGAHEYRDRAALRVVHAWFGVVAGLVRSGGSSVST
jgi:hypothetical protein